jgi:hypothetical protein
MVHENTGIYNGAKGTVVGIAFIGDMPTETIPKHCTFHTMAPREIPTVYVAMDQPIGYSIAKGMKSVIPFVSICNDEDKYHRKYHRRFMPLEPAFACTTHKMQGATAKYGAVIEPSSAYPFARGLHYVAASRPTELSKLFLLSPLNNTHFTAWPHERLEVKREYLRLANESFYQQNTIDLSLRRSNPDPKVSCPSIE